MANPAYTHVQVRLRPDEVDVLDWYRASQKNPPSRQHAAEQFFRRALHDLLWAKETRPVNGA
jgi:hypothetical protein